MSRSGYSDDCENIGLWRGAVRRATHGKRGQALLRDLVTALDAMPEKRLGRGALKDADGCHCTLGVVADARGLDMSEVSFDDYGFSAGSSRHAFAARFDVASALAQEIMFENDEGSPWNNRNETPEQRWRRMRQWAAARLNEPEPQA